MNKIIALAGRKGSGKSEISKVLLKEGFEKISFADWMKIRLSDFFKIDSDYFYNSEYKELPFSSLNLENIIWDEDLAKKFSLFINEDFDTSKYKEITSLRDLMQFVGTDLLRAKDDLFHVKKTFASLEPNKRYVCDDLRFTNELEYLKSIGSSFKPFYVLRPFNWSNISNHSSEIDLKWNKFSQLIFNTQDSAEEFVSNTISNVLNDTCYDGTKQDNSLNNNAFLSFENVLSEHIIVAYLQKTKQMAKSFISQTIKFDKFTSYNWINTVFKDYFLTHANIDANKEFTFDTKNPSHLLILENLKLWSDQDYLIKNLPFDLKDEYISELNSFSSLN
jgi:hypothetical protein